ncbi:MAG TPA: hemerythrin domain-containing protein [Methylomirabilota bacterium]|nr:hemerythrin domain-containing protein [Methylomirabilota bacterium]
MDPIETLMNEHRVIERVLDALEAFADEAQRKGSTEKEELVRFVAFLREFADACHHGKEEDILFRTMIEHGFPANGGPIAVMLHEHDQGRALVRALRGKSEQAAPWSADDLRAVAEAVHGFAGLLHAHIHKEDAVLYPMAEQHLPPEVMARVGAECERYEAEKTGAGEHERFHALAEALVARYAPATHPRAPARGFSCCG